MPGDSPVVEMFLATSLGLPAEAVGLLIAVDGFTGFTGIVRTFLNVNGDTCVAMLVTHADGQIDRGVYNGTTDIKATNGDETALAEPYAKADSAD